MPEDPAAAYGWLTLAAAAEPEGAVGLLAEALRAALGERMALKEIERGRDLAAAFEPVEGPPAGGLPGEAATLAGAAPPLAAACDGGDDDLAPSLCRVVGLLADRPAEPDPGMGIVLRGADGGPVEVFEDGDNLIVEVPPPAGDGAPRHVAVDYFVHDDNVLHMFPGDAAPPPAGEPLVLGDPATPGGQTWRIGPPFGRDLLAVFVSEDPLHEVPRPQVEPTADYLDALGPP